MSDERQSPEAIAKELLIAYIEKSGILVDTAHTKNDKSEEVGICIGKAYQALLAEIKK